MELTWHTINLQLRELGRQKREQREIDTTDKIENISKAVRKAVEDNDRDEHLRHLSSNKRIPCNGDKVFKEETASRKVSRLNILVNSMQVA